MADRHPEPLESLDPRFLAILLKGTTQRIELRVGEKYSHEMLQRLQLRLHTIRRKQKDVNPELWKALYRATVRWIPSEGRLIVEPRDSDLDALLTEVTGESKPTASLPENIPQEVRHEMDFLEHLVDKGKD